MSCWKGLFETLGHLPAVRPPRRPQGPHLPNGDDKMIYQADQRDGSCKAHGTELLNRAAAVVLMAPGLWRDPQDLSRLGAQP